jgi:molecular chaperone GrpE
MEEEILEPDEELVEEEGLKDKLKKMRDELKQCRKEKDEYLAGWQRAKADFINARKDDEKVREEFLKFASAGVLSDFLEVADAFIEALKMKPGEDLERIYSKFEEVMKRNGIEVVECDGMKFDPSLHEALEQEEVDDEKKDGTILEEMQRGYKLRGQVLRAAKVKVGVLSAKGGSASCGKK